MAASKILPVVLCGGSGTRLWPLSRRELPKQFAPMLGEKTLFEAALERAQALCPAQILCIGADSLRHEIGLRLSPARSPVRIVLEPEGRNTAAAAAAALAAARDAGPDAILVLLPSDHHVEDVGAFTAAVTQAAEIAADGRIVTLGIPPTAPATGYGYIVPGAELKGSAGRAQVARFVEKPEAQQARELLAQGALWNAGVYVARADVLRAAFISLAPDILAGVEAAFAQASCEHMFIRPDGEYASVRSQSIDHAIAEKWSGMAVVPFAGGWSDLGTWSALIEAGTALPASADAKLIGCERTHVKTSGRLVAGIGLTDILIVDTPDAVLIAHRSQSDQVKELVAGLAAEGRGEVVQHRKVGRPWGAYESLDRGPRHQVKRITVKPGASLSLQYHEHRAEHWIVVRGTAQVTCDGKVFQLGENQSTYIPLGSLHRLDNPGPEPLELIEVQTGAYLGEDDIVRVTDTYGRAEPQG